MKRTSWFAFPILLFILCGCAGAGGGGSGGVGEVSGLISDANGDIVRGARVYRGSTETTSNSSGIYVLSNVAAGDVTISAEVTRNGIRFSGQNVVSVFRGERSQNLNIAVVRDSLQASIHGTVRDRFGNKVQGARVFALGNAFSSNVDITDSNGEYSIRGLQSGLTYDLTASARTFDSDTSSVLLASGENRLINFTLDDESNPSLPAPQNLAAVAWTSPFEATRSPSHAAAIEAVRRLIDPRRATSRGSSRTTGAGNHVEVDLYWDPLPGQYYVSLLGFGIYRATSALGQATAIDYLRDPNALYYANIDDALVDDATYYYEVTALNTSYPDFANSESPPSNRYGVTTLGDLFLDDVTQGPLTFHWQAATGASQYSVYLFDEFPSIGVTQIWDTESSPTGGTSQVYNGPALQSGHHYYYVVFGSANGLSSRTLSDIGGFIAN